MKVGAGLIRAVRRYGDTVTTMARPALSVPAWVSGTVRTNTYVIIAVFNGGSAQWFYLRVSLF